MRLSRVGNDNNKPGTHLFLSPRGVEPYTISVEALSRQDAWSRLTTMAKQGRYQGRLNLDIDLSSMCYGLIAGCMWLGFWWLIVG